MWWCPSLPEASNVDGTLGIHPHDGSSPTPVRHRSDTSPTPVRHRSDTGPIPVRHQSDTGPTPVRHRSDIGPTPASQSSQSWVITALKNVRRFERISAIFRGIRVSPGFATVGGYDTSASAVYGR